MNHLRRHLAPMDPPLCRQGHLAEARRESATRLYYRLNPTADRRRSGEAVRIVAYLFDVEPNSVYNWLNGHRHTCYHQAA